MSRLTRRAFVLLALAILPLAGACHGSKARPPIPEQPKTFVAVTNNNFLDMTVYVVRSGGSRLRLGVAGSNRTTRFEIPGHVIFGATAISFIADPIGSNRQPTSQEITVSPGDEVRLVIP